MARRDRGGGPAWPDTATPVSRDRGPPLPPACAGAGFGISHRFAGEMGSDLIRGFLVDENDQVSAELALLLEAYLRGEATVDDVLAFEGPYSLAGWLDSGLQRQLELLALIGEEVEFLDRPREDMDAVVREVAAELLAPIEAAVVD